METQTGHHRAMPPAQAALAAGVRADLAFSPPPHAGRPSSLRLRLLDTATDAPLTDIVESHERPIHLIAVRRALDHFQHLHPTATPAAGEYAAELVFPEDGAYVLFTEFARAEGQHVVARHDLSVGEPSGPALLQPDDAPKTAHGVRVRLAGHEALRAGASSTLTFTVEDAGTGAAVRDLRPYLGAAAHVVLLTEEAGAFGHAHAEPAGAATGHNGHDRHPQPDPPPAFGPTVAFNHVFPAPGLYKLWGQLQLADGSVITADFVVRVH